MQQHTTANHQVWIDKNSCSIDEFKTSVEQITEPATVLLADDIQNNIPIYDAAKIRSAVEQDNSAKLRQYMAEWNQVFQHGAGVMVFPGAYEDLSTVDATTDVLNNIMLEEQAKRVGGGDHFAAAGVNTRLWNAHEKLCVATPELFARYYANHIIAWVSHSWLGPYYQITAAVNVVHPGSKAQTSHRDYHMGFQPIETLTQYPAHIHALSAALTLQAAVAHSDMPIDSGPTKLLPFSQTYLPGYIAANLPEFQAYFEEYYVQLPLQKGDMLFFNPAVFHAAGENNTADLQRFANLMQIGSGYGRSIEFIDRARMCESLYPALCKLKNSDEFSKREIDNIIAACAEGYSFPANLDLDSPLSGMAAPSQQDLMQQALQENWNQQRFMQALNAQTAKKRSH